MLCCGMSSSTTEPGALLLPVGAPRLSLCLLSLLLSTNFVVNVFSDVHLITFNTKITHLSDARAALGE